MSVETERLYLESFAQPLTKSTWLAGAVVVLSVALAGMVALNVYTINSERAKKPYVVRIDSLGRADKVDSDGFKYAPQEAEVRHSFSEFVRFYYTRNRYAITAHHGGLSDSLYFFDEQHGEAIQQQWTQTQMIKKFLADPTSQEIDIYPKQVSHFQLREPPYQVSVIFEERVGQNPPKMFTSDIVFNRLDKVPDELTEVNPLGFMIEEIHTEPYLQ